jgi:hypothetical protein
MVDEQKRVEAAEARDRERPPHWKAAPSMVLCALMSRAPRRVADGVVAFIADSLPRAGLIILTPPRMTLMLAVSLVAVL